MVTEGYVPEVGDELAVTENDPAAMSVLVGLGVAWPDGRYFEVYSAKESLSIPAADGSNPRIDRVVVRNDLDNRQTVLAVVQGTPAVSPSAPALTRTSTTYEISLAQVAVAAGATSITNANITDERDDAALCGRAEANGFTGHAEASPIDHPDLSVTTAKLADSSVTEAKLADSSVTEAKLADSSVTEAKLADSSVTEAKLDFTPSRTANGSYTGDGSTSNRFISVGFTPKLVFVVSNGAEIGFGIGITGSNYGAGHSSTAGLFRTNTPRLIPSLTTNGFNVRDTGSGSLNYSGETYYWVAIG